MRSVSVELDDEEEARFVAAYPALRRFAFVLADADVDAEDLLHEALTRMLERGSSSEIVDLEAFGRRTIVRVASNTRRSLGRRRRMIERVRALRPAIEAPPASGDLGDLLAVGPIDRAILYLFVVEGRPHGEVAELVGLSETATRARYSRALRRLRVTTEGATRGDD